jgi:hypothetical protein
VLLQTWRAERPYQVLLRVKLPAKRLVLVRRHHRRLRLAYLGLVVADLEDEYWCFDQFVNRDDS